MARCKVSLHCLPAGTVRDDDIARIPARSGTTHAVQRRSDGEKQLLKSVMRHPPFHVKSSVVLVGLCILHWHLAVLLAEGSKRGAAGGGTTGSRGRTGSADRVPRGHTYSFFRYLFGSSVPSSVVITYALLVGGAAAALFFLRRPSRSSAAGSGAATGDVLRKDDAKRTFRPCASICLNDILLKRNDGGKLCIEESAVQPFLSLCGWSKLYVFVQVKDDEEDHVMKELERIQAFDHGLLRHRVMFCSTVEGRASMVRQLQPLTHVDADSCIGVTLNGKVPNVVCLREPLKECVDILQAALKHR